MDPRNQPSSPPYSPQFPPAVAAEWQELRPYSPVTPFPSTFRSFTPRSSRPHSPPSLSPSPCPSLVSCQSQYPDVNSIEIEELSAEDDGADSGVELLVGEYEEAPENYAGYDHYDEEDDESSDTQQSVLYGLERLTASQTPSPLSRAWAQRLREQGGQHHGQPTRAKRSYSESIGSDSDYDSGRDSTSSYGGRIRRRRLDKRREIETRSASTRSTPDFNFQMEM